MKKDNKNWLTAAMLRRACLDAVIKLSPVTMVKNPVMFVVELGLLITIPLSFYPIFSGYNLTVAVVLLITLLFANLAEAVAEGRGKAQAAALRSSRQESTAYLVLPDGSEREISAGELNCDDVIIVRAGELIPGDGDVIEGIASVDESAITGESAPVVKECGGDFSSVTGGTTVVSDWLRIRITAQRGEAFLDRMIAMVEGAHRSKTPNEVALGTLLITLTAVFLMVILTLPSTAGYIGATLSIPVLVALTVCLIPTTIGGLLSAIGIAGMDRVTRFNVIAMSGKAVEACGDVDTIILDKTGTITYGNRMAADFIPIDGVTRPTLAAAAVQSSLGDDTPEGRSVIILGEGDYGSQPRPADGTVIPFTAQSRMSGVDTAEGRHYRKGSYEAVSAWVQGQGGKLPDDLYTRVSEVSKLGGTPLVVAIDNRVLGVIYLKDTVKAGLAERFAELRRMGIRTVMCTGDNPLTAATIAEEAGVDSFIAECRPEDKIEAIQHEQAQGRVVAMTGDGTNDAPALAQADVGIAMNSGTTAAKEAANMVDLDSDPTKLIEVVGIGKQLLMTRGALTTFSIANDLAKYFAILPAIFLPAVPSLAVLNLMSLATPASAVLSALIFNAIIIPMLIPIAMRGVRCKPMPADKLLRRNLLIYGLGGVITPFVGIKLIDLVLAPLLGVMGL